MDNETKDLLVEVIDLLKARNEADEKEEKEKAEDLKGDKEKKEPVEEKEKAENEEEKEEKEEKEAENKCKAKNEDDVVDKRDIIRQIMAIAGKHEDNEDVKTIAKLAEKLSYEKSEEKTADNKCTAKNSLDSNIEEFYTEVKKSSTGYITQEKARELGKQLY